ncbi:anthranilate synthase component II [Rodentibacter pneumotropicus]|uniref:anthranilate synthase component II n=1 Tax=Rodentibacter pneumotropicus TaxID=758 RepID=UPI00038298D6|nr:anthranilate synthase component II [Rodentibacter pneumotropicus]NBH75681.1 anthranilate synthase component II [Rodentibacter pneumotropicus]OOF60947.1 anthranilate synthase component II [Rodentibacter pneumotropicus]THA03929.1 anthranilate synthase component II [Rodentibacter pneumotropicus]THA06300.1 anthranilate synthase component II [Rodentibacter pneumotropicus]THA12735.1 anthranilate synthase component II [Rodentibacter pneumotropicus]
MKLLIIDNHDSFTFNLVELVRRLGVTFDVLNVEDLQESTPEFYSHLLISPGPDVPRAYPQLFEMLERYHQKKSMLGVCLGHQTLCEFFGGRLYNLDQVRHGQKRRVKVRSNSPLFSGLPVEFDIGLYHSWAVQDENFPEELEIIAMCDENVVMAMQHKFLPIYGVQFHPESYMSEYGEQILRNWLNINP